MKQATIREWFVSEVAFRCRNCAAVSYQHIYMMADEVAFNAGGLTHTYWSKLSDAGAKRFANSVAKQMGIKKVSQVTTFRSYQ